MNSPITSIKNNKRSLERLRLACQELKYRLTLLERYKISIENLSGDFDFELSLSRDQFEEMFHADFKALLVGVIDQVLRESEMLSSEIDELLLVGGSSRVPFVEEIALERNCCKLTLEVLEKNYIAINSYKKFGFNQYQLIHVAYHISSVEFGTETNTEIIYYCRSKL